MKKETENTLKFKKLKAMAGLATWEAKGLLVALWQFTASNAPQGDLGRFSNEDIAYGIEFPLERIDAVVGVLVATRWLDESAAHRLIVHDWKDHCEDAVKMRLARAGLAFADGTPSTPSKMSKEERAKLPPVAGTAPAACVPDVRTPCARNEEKPPAVGTTETDTETRTVTRPIPKPEPKPGPARVSAVSAFSDSVGSGSVDPRAYRQALWKRLKAVVLRGEGVADDGRDPPHCVEWWQSVAKMVFDAPGGFAMVEEVVRYVEDCRNPAVQAAKGLGDLTRPAAFVASRCRDFLKPLGVRLPAPVKG